MRSTTFDRKAGLARFIDDRVVVWLACVVAAIAGWYIAVDRPAAAIDAQIAGNDRAAARIRLNAAIVAARPRLEADERATDAMFDRLDLRTDRPTAVARFIGDLARRAGAHHVLLIAIDDAHAGVADPRASAATGTNEPFERIPLEVTLSGSYRDILAVCRELAGAPVVVQFEIAALERRDASSAGDRSTPLTAHVHVRLVRFIDREPRAPSVDAAARSGDARSF